MKLYHVTGHEQALVILAHGFGYGEEDREAARYMLSDQVLDAGEGVPGDTALEVEWDVTAGELCPYFDADSLPCAYRVYHVPAALINARAKVRLVEPHLSAEALARSRAFYRELVEAGHLTEERAAAEERRWRLWALRDQLRGRS